MEGDRLSPALQRQVEWLIPSDGADYLDPRARQARYASPLVIEGVEIALNSALAFHKPARQAHRYGQLGSPTLGLGGQSGTPVTVQGLPGAPRQITAGAEHVCAQMPGQAIYCWGRDGFGQLGDGEALDSFVPEAAQLGP
jgi:Regulator of chromosome condensation (RCC1) repeat